MYATLPGCTSVVRCAAVVLLPVEREGELAVDALLGRASVGIGIWIKKKKSLHYASMTE